MKWLGVVTLACALMPAHAATIIVSSTKVDYRTVRAKVADANTHNLTPENMSDDESAASLRWALRWAGTAAVLSADPGPQEILQALRLLDKLGACNDAALVVRKNAGAAPPRCFVVWEDTSVETCDDIVPTCGDGARRLAILYGGAERLVRVQGGASACFAELRRPRRFVLVDCQ